MSASGLWAVVAHRIACFAIGAFLVAHGWVFWPALIIIAAAFGPSKVYERFAQEGK